MAFQDNGDRDKVQAATDLVRLIGEQINLKAKGREFVGLCPFHDDKKPSMQVSPQKQIYKCFSCGAGGDAFSFVMNYHKMTFVESLKYLAQRAGIELTPWTPGKGSGIRDQGSEKRADERKALAEANERAVGFYRAMLRHVEHGAEARAYLERRGVTAEMIDTFQLGYAPDRWDGLVQTIPHKGWDAKPFEAAGLIKPRKTGDGSFDFLRHRLIFPIFDAIGRPIAFGGRKLREEDEPKYLNSPETPLFHKSATLYGLHAAKKPIIDAKTAVLVEGYTDVIACHQAGACNVVAALGTALTAEHVRELRRYCEHVILVMDGDAAGQKAADRAIEVFLTGDLDVSIAVLPDGQDPDELLKTGGLERWNEVLTTATDAITFQFERVAEQLDGGGTVTGRQRVAEGFMRRLMDLGLTKTGTVRRSLVIAQLAELLHLSESDIDRWIRDQPPPRRPARSAPPPPPPPEAKAPEARTPDDSHSAQATDSSSDSAPPDDEAYAAAMATAEDGEGPSPEDLDAAAAVSQNSGSDTVAIRDSRSRLKAVEAAELRLIAGVVRDNALFQLPLPDGSTLDEAISPAEMSRPDHRRLYQRVYDTLADGHDLTLAGLLGAFAEEGERELIHLLTHADHELDVAAGATRGGSDGAVEEGGSGGNLPPVLRDAAEASLAFARETQYRKTREKLMRDAAADPEALLRRTQEHHRANPSAVRIARL